MPNETETPTPSLVVWFFDELDQDFLDDCSTNEAWEQGQNHCVYSSAEKAQQAVLNELADRYKEFPDDADYRDWTPVWESGEHGSISLEDADGHTWTVRPITVDA